MRRWPSWSWARIWPRYAPSSRPSPNRTLTKRIAASPAEKTAMILAGLAADEAWKRAVAADCLVAVSTPDRIQAVATAVPGLPLPGKIAAFVALKQRSNPPIRQAALKSLAEPDAEVRLAALAAIRNRETITFTN